MNHCHNVLTKINNKIIISISSLKQLLLTIKYFGCINEKKNVLNVKTLQY